MTRRMYWGITILILLLGSAAVFIIVNERAENSKLNDQLEDAAELANQIDQRKIAENNQTSEVINTEQVQPMANDDVQVLDVPIENSQQNDSVETVHVENYLEGLTDIDLLESITLPTDAELASYTDGDIMEYGAQLHEAARKERAISKKYVQQRISLADAQRAIYAGDIDDKSGLKIKELNKQYDQLLDIGKLLNEQRERLSKESSRFQQHTRGF